MCMRVPLVAGIVCGLFLMFSVTSARSGEVSGPFAKSVSASDVTQIKIAVSKERSVSHNVKKIEAVRPDKLVIQTTSRTAVDEDTTCDFNVYRRAGKWTIDTNSIQVSIEKRDLRTNSQTFIR